jgi:hypothetical protein
MSAFHDANMPARRFLPVDVSRIASHNTARATDRRVPAGTDPADADVQVT